jgi:GntR family transcriptional regulator / MocR family aminotransferase
MMHVLLTDCLDLDRTLEEPLHRQLYRHLRRLIEERVLPAGSKLPSSRSLASELRIARNTVLTVYEQLTADGYVSVRHGARAQVVDLPPVPTKKSPSAKLPPLSRRGLAMQSSAGTLPPHDVLETGNFPFGTWSRVVARHALRSLGSTYHDGSAGDPALRKAIADYIGVARGARCEPEQVVVTTCAQAARDLVGRLLLDPGDSAWVEEPGLRGAHDAVAAAGADLVPLRVEGRDWSLETSGSRPKLVYVSPANQRPLALTMKTGQRLHLLELAEALEALIVEDDFDGDYNFGPHPVPTLHSLASGRVIYLGNFDRLLFPAMRIGFLVLPPSLVQAFQRSLDITGQNPPLLLQAALADFIEGGHMTRHLSKVRTAYAERRRLFRRLCEAHLGDWLTLTEGDVGFSCVGLMTGHFDDVAIAAHAASCGLCVSPLSAHYWFGDRRAGLVMGFGPLSESEIPRAVDLLRQSFQLAVGKSA